MNSKTFCSVFRVNYNDIKRVETTKVPWGEEIGGRCQGNLITFFFLLASILLEKRRRRQNKVFIYSLNVWHTTLWRYFSFFAAIFIQSFNIETKVLSLFMYTLWCRKSMLKCVNDVSRLKAKQKERFWRIFKEHRIIFQSLMACQCESCFWQFPSQPRTFWIYFRAL